MDTDGRSLGQDEVGSFRLGTRLPAWTLVRPFLNKCDVCNASVTISEVEPLYTEWEEPDGQRRSIWHRQVVFACAPCHEAGRSSTDLVMIEVEEISG